MNIIEDDWTPLMLATLYGYLEISQLLIEKGSDVDIKDKDGKTVLIWATLGGHF